jgi:hypothetical protein
LSAQSDHYAQRVEADAEFFIKPGIITIIRTFKNTARAFIEELKSNGGAICYLKRKGTGVYVYRDGIHMLTCVSSSSVSEDSLTRTEIKKMLISESQLSGMGYSFRSVNKGLMAWEILADIEFVSVAPPWQKFSPKGFLGCD